ncbi:Peptide transporter family 2 [Aphelenchoides bicaudatus]|nr:Peptide transporter family 2 [Aphelenchoides bicaudatus]
MAFGLCALLMFFSLLIFAAGICVYRPVVLVENPILRALDAIKIALYCKFKGIGPTRDEWIDYYLNAHDCTKSLDCIQASRGRPAGSMPNCPHAKFLDEVKAIFRLIVMFFPVPFFWALYQQQVC